MSDSIRASGSREPRRLRLPRSSRGCDGSAESDQHRDDPCKHKRWQVWCDLEPDWYRQGQLPTGQRLQDRCGERKAGQPTGDREQHRLEQQLSRNHHAGGAERESDGDLTEAVGITRDAMRLARLAHAASRTSAASAITPMTNAATGVRPALPTNPGGASATSRFSCDRGYVSPIDRATVLSAVVACSSETCGPRRPTIQMFRVVRSSSDERPRSAIAWTSEPTARGETRPRCRGSREAPRRRWCTAVR